METINERTQLPIDQTLNLLIQCRDILFDSAPVMMHSIDDNGILVKVNKLWLTTFGYKPEEVLGRKSTEFLTDESRAQALAVTLSLFRETGRAHSIAYSFVHKNGRVIDVLLDAVTSYDLKGERITLAALRDRGDLEQWKWATSSIKTLQSLDAVQRYIRLTLSATGSDEVAQLEPQSSGSLRESLELATEDLIVLTDDITDHLRQLTEIEKQRFHDEQNSRQVLFTLADTIRVALAA